MSRCTVETPPIKVGTVLAEGAPEPPVGTILHADGNAWRRYTDGWASTGGNLEVPWENLRPSMLTVLYVGGES